MIDQAALIETMTGLVIFEIAGQEFFADIRNISAIINPSELSRKENLLSRENPHVEINNLSIPVIPLHKYFQLELNFKTEDQRILIIETDDSHFGFFVERVKEIFTMTKEFKEKLSFGQTNEKDYLTGILNYEDRVLYLPDFQKILIHTR